MVCAQTTPRPHVTSIERASHIVIPQCRGYPVTRGNPDLLLTGIRAHVEIQGRTATTTLQLDLSNHGSRPAEAVVLLPIPDGATVGGFDFKGGGSEPSAELLPKSKAKSMYRSIVSRLRDPALLEFAGYRMLKTSVFPVPAGGSQSVRITYDEILEGDGSRVDYVLPRSASLDYRVPWEITVDIHEDVATSAVYSPTHTLSKDAAGKQLVRVKTLDTTNPGAFHLSYLQDGDELAASLFAYPDPTVGGGYFLMMASVPDRARKTLPREVTLVIDRSGSMAGQKLEQAKQAARDVLADLGTDEVFNIVTYSNSVSMFSKQPVSVAEFRDNALAWIDTIRPSGGTNISDALLETLRQPHAGKRVPLVLFLTDGLPTLGKRSESEIQQIVHLGNRYDRRIYTFGVGDDVNSPLLDRVAEMTRGASSYVLPSDRIDTQVAKVIRRLRGPVMTRPSLVTLDKSGQPSTRLVTELLPHRLPDLYAGEQLVILGQYTDQGPITFQIHGHSGDERRAFGFNFSLDQASTRNGFVPRLWASRRIAFLSDAIRQSGAVASSLGPQKELVDEVLRLSTEFGVLTEYTAFLAQEGTDLAWTNVVANCTSNFATRAMQTRTGRGAVNQGWNSNFMKNQAQLNPRNGYLGQNLQVVEHSRLQQLKDRSFVHRNNQWLDTRLIQPGVDSTVHETVEFASPRYFEILDRLERDGRQGSMSLRGRTILILDGQNLLLKQGKLDGC